MAEGGGAENATVGTLRHGRSRPIEIPIPDAAAKAARPYNKARRAHNSPISVARLAATGTLPQPQRHGNSAGGGRAPTAALRLYAA